MSRRRLENLIGDTVRRPEALSVLECLVSCNFSVASAIDSALFRENLLLVVKIERIGLKQFGG